MGEHGLSCVSMCDHSLLAMVLLLHTSCLSLTRSHSCSMSLERHLKLSLSSGDSHSAPPPPSPTRVLPRSLLTPLPLPRLPLRPSQSQPRWQSMLLPALIERNE